MAGTVLDQAQNFSGGQVAAARQRDRWSQREAKATDDETREQYREAIADLEARYPEIADVPIGGAEAFARERGHGTGARSPVHGGRRRSGGGTRTSKRSSPAATTASEPQRKPTPGLDPTARRTKTSSRASRDTPHVDRAIRRTGIPATLDSGGSTALATLGATVGLSLAYLVFTSAETPGTGAAAVPSIIEGITRALGRFLSLGDVFPSNRAARAGGGAGAAGAAYNEGPGSNVATAAARLKAAGRHPLPVGKEGDRRKPPFKQPIRHGQLANPPFQPRK